jgi:hypothetical protein
MFNISDLLKRFSKFEKETKESNDAIAAAIKEVCGIDGAQFELKRGVITIKSHPTVKSAIYMKKGALLKRLSQYPNLKVYDVR